MTAADPAPSDRVVKSKSARGRAAKGARADDDEQPVWTPFAEALDAFYRSAADAWVRDDIERRAAEAYEGVLEALRGAPDAGAVQTRILDANRTFNGKVRDLGADGSQQLAQAYADYVADLNDLGMSDEVAERVGTAFGEYSTVLADAASLSDVQARAATAYEDYLRALQGAWASVDTESLDVGTLAAIAQSTLTAAQAQAMTLNAIGQAHVATALVTAGSPLT